MLKTHQLVMCALITCVSGFAQNEDLDHGRKEIRLFGGSAVGNAVLHAPAFSGGVEAAVRLNRFIALTGNYAYNNLGSQTLKDCSTGGCTEIAGSGRADEFMGGIRVSVPNRHRITPYVALTLGGVRVEATARVTSPSGNFSDSQSETKFGAGLGAGLDYRISRRFGFSVDARAIEPVPTAAWYVRTTGGLYFRF
jgi:opacity protein-like surface antigen